MDETDADRLAHLDDAVACIERGETDWQRQVVTQLDRIAEAVNELAVQMATCVRDIGLTNGQMQTLGSLWESDAVRRTTAPAPPPGATYRPTPAPGSVHVPTLRPVLEEKDGGSP